MYLVITQTHLWRYGLTHSNTTMEIFILLQTNVSSTRMTIL